LKQKANRRFTARTPSRPGPGVAPQVALDDPREPEQRETLYAIINTNKGESFPC